jgi:hypothetical protein
MATSIAEPIITEPTTGLPTRKWDVDYKGFQGTICQGRYGLYIQAVGKNKRNISIKLTEEIQTAIIKQAEEHLDRED